MVKRKHCPCKPGSVPRLSGGCLSFIYDASHPAPPAFYPPSYDSGGQPSDDGIHELAAPSRHSPMITHRLVVSYTTFSPLPNTPLQGGWAVVLFCRHLLSPIASTFRSGAPYAARTFLPCLVAPATDRNSVFGCKGNILN